MRSRSARQRLPAQSATCTAESCGDISFVVDMSGMCAKLKLKADLFDDMQIGAAAVSVLPHALILPPPRTPAHEHDAE